jgi:hypothetical protein
VEIPLTHGSGDQEVKEHGVGFGKGLSTGSQHGEGLANTLTTH